MIMNAESAQEATNTEGRTMNRHAVATARPITLAEWQRILGDIVQPEVEPGRRTLRRYVVSGEVELAFEIDDEPFQRTVPLLNVSPRGLTVKVYEPIPVEQAVIVRILLEGETRVFCGHVIHCTMTLGGFKVGIRLDFPSNHANGAARFGAP
jgi:hypothetical protein